jgi:hypothetical protein
VVKLVLKVVVHEVVVLLLVDLLVEYVVVHEVVVFLLVVLLVVPITYPKL